MSSPSDPSATIEISRVEKLALQVLREQRSARRWRIFFRFCWLALAAAIAWFVIKRESLSLNPAVGEHTAVVTIAGTIGPESYSNADNIVASLKEAFEAKMSKAVLIRINSPGGSPVHAGIINDELMRLKALHKKKVYVVIDQLATSAAYYVAAAADHIYADKASMVGSIGVVMEGFGISDAMQRYGVERRVIKAGQFKNMLDPFSPKNPDEVSRMQAVVDEVHQQFIHVIRTERGNRLKETPDMFSGMVWTGDQAVKLGLVDGLGNVSYVAREQIKAENMVDYSYQQSVAERLAQRIGAYVSLAMTSSLPLQSAWQWR